MALSLVIKRRERATGPSGPASKLASGVSGSVHNPNGKYVNEHMLKPIGVVKPLERPSCTQLMRKPIVNPTAKIRNTDMDMLVTAFLSRNPHYEYIEKTKHNGRLRYWFIVRESGVKHVFWRDEIKDSLRGPRERGAADTSDVIQPEKFVPTHRPLTRYELYLKTKYGTTRPFSPVPAQSLPTEDNFEYKDPLSYVGLKTIKRFTYGKKK